MAGPVATCRVESSLIMLQLRSAACTFLFACQARANKMLEDMNTGIAWVMDHVASFGGDPSNVTLVGQSAGAHLGALALFHQVRADDVSNA